MRLIDWSSLDADGRRAALARPQRRSETRVSDGVRAIFDDVDHNLRGYLGQLAKYSS